MGKPVTLCAFQRTILHGIYDTPTRRAIISFGRKNAKTTLSAFLLLLHLCGPEAHANSQLYSAAQSREQAALLFSLASKMVRMSPDLHKFVTVRDTAKQLLCKDLGTQYRALSAEASTAYGLSPAFIVHDELGQVHGPRSELYEALETGTAAQAEPLSIIISTQAPTDADLLSVLIDDAKTGADPFVKLFLFEADRERDPFHVDTIRQANPAFEEFQNQREVLAMAEEARRMPSKEAEYRNLILNQRVERVSLFVAPMIWKANGGEPVRDFGDLPVYGGLDLSTTTDLTACMWVARLDGRWHVKPVFWLPEEGLTEKARLDRAPYDVWAQQGFLRTTPGKTISYEYVAAEMVAMMRQMHVVKVGFDRWNMPHFKPWLLKADMPEDVITQTFEEFGQGFKDMNHAVRNFETLLLNEEIRHGNHPVLSMCAACAVIRKDPAGNRKFDKDRSRGRIDGIVALAMALGVTDGTPDGQTIQDELMVL